MAINKRLISGLLGGGVTILAASLGGIKLKDNLDYNTKINYYGKLSSYFSEHAPAHIKGDYYMPKWEDDSVWKNIHKREGGKIIGKRETFENYQKMRDACYEKLSNDKNFDGCFNPNESWCTSCAGFKSSLK